MTTGMKKQVLSAGGSLVGYGLAKLLNSQETQTVILSVMGGLVGYSVADKVTTTKRLKSSRKK